MDGNGDRRRATKHLTQEGTGMANATRRSWQSHPVGRLLFTVDVEPVEVDRNVERRRSLADVTEQLVELLAAQRLSATWAVGEPARAAIGPLVALCEVPQELALAGDSSWVGPTAGRAAFARELSRRLTQARAAGIDVATLVPRVASVKPHIDLVVKHGIRAVVATSDATRQRASSLAPRALHYGVWEFAVSQRLPIQSTWLAAGGMRLQRRVSRSAAEAATVHLQLDAPALAEAGRAAMTTLARLARQIAKLRDRGLLHVETLGAAAARLSVVPTATPQRSILRLAA